MGFFSGLNAEKYDRKYRDRDLVKRILVYFKPEARKILVVAVFTILVSLASASSVLIISRAVDLLAKDPRLASILIISFLALFIGIFYLGFQPDQPADDDQGYCQRGHAVGQ